MYTTRNPETASPLVSFNFYSDFLEDKQLCLARGDFMPQISKKVQPWYLTLPFSAPLTRTCLYRCTALPHTLHRTANTCSRPCWRGTPTPRPRCSSRCTFSIKNLRTLLLRSLSMFARSSALHEPAPCNETWRYTGGGGTMHGLADRLQHLKLQITQCIEFVNECWIVECVLRIFK